MGSQAEPAEGERKRLLEVRTGSRCQLSANMRLRGAFGALPTVLVLMVHETLAEDLFTPSKCVSTIVSCCNPDQPVGQHPFRCFEVNECAGLYWEGTNACSDRPRRNWILLRPGQLVRPRVHPASNKHYLTIGGIGAV